MIYRYNSRNVQGIVYALGMFTQDNQLSVIEFIFLFRGVFSSCFSFLAMSPVVGIYNIYGSKNITWAKPVAENGLCHWEANGL